MSEPFKSEAEKNQYEETANAIQKNAVCVGERIKSEVRNNLVAVLFASTAISLFTGYVLSRRREAQKRAEWADTIFRLVKEWLNEGRKKGSGPIKAGVDYALAAAQEASSKGAEYGHRLNPFHHESHRRFLGIF